MIIFIGGMSHTGKTILAQKLLEKFNMPYLSLDHLKMGLCRGLDEEKYSPIQDYRILGAKMWPIVKGIAMTAIENGQHMIIEGCYYLPHFEKDFSEEYSKEILPVFLGFSSDYIKENYDDIRKTHASVIEKRGEIFGEPIKDYIKQHAELKEECEKNNSTYFEIDMGYSEKIGDVINYIEKNIVI